MMMEKKVGIGKEEGERKNAKQIEIESSETTEPNLHKDRVPIEL